MKSMKPAFIWTFALYMVITLPRPCFGQTEVHKPAVQTEKDPALADAQDEIVRDAEILVFDNCSLLDEKTRQYCGIEVVYALSHDLTDGRIQVFNDLKIEAEYPLPDLSAEKHLTRLGYQGFYWSEKEEQLPDPDLFFAIGTTGINDSISSLWRESDPSAYDYKPEPCKKHPEDLCDDAAMFRGDEVGITSISIPGKRNLELRAKGDLPEIEISGVGFSEGTEVECGRGVDPKRIFKAPLRDVRVVSTVSHDDEQDIPVLKAGRFTVPKEIFEYPSHIRIVGRVKQ